jgi:hypothetical protein
MKRFSLFACIGMLAATSLRAAPAPDFWYVVPDTTHSTTANRLAQGIVIPSETSPTIQTTPTGSVVSWHRADGTKQSLVVKGVSSFTFEPGPMKGTTYVPFAKRKALQYNPDRCCICASWNNMEESFELMTCVTGCNGCGCEACVCSPTSPCPESSRHAMTLVAHNDPANVISIGASGVNDGISMSGRGAAAVGFRGKHVSASLTPEGETQINNPDSITIPGRVASKAIVRGDTALFAWWSPETAVMLQQPRSMPAPVFRDGTVEFNPTSDATLQSADKQPPAAPVMDRCRVCGTHPNSGGDVDRMVCIPGNGTCYRCISFECFAPES